MKTIAQAIVAKSLKAGMDPFLIAAMMIQESRLNPSAVSWAGAQGIGQLMPGTARELGVLTDKRDDRLQAQASMDGAIRYLKEQLERFAGRVDFALAAYNAGYGTVQEAGGVPNIPETRNYVREIKARRDWLKRQAARTGA
ncbi:MAG: lytic transglycosylase domain-containing protein [Elusimicrobia bacterium]|nr:lytic transglycosylase domain-containing protein [Elusimicrobiota bacterium]